MRVGDKHINSSFNARCLNQTDLHENYFVAITQQILPTTNAETRNNYQLTYTCNKIMKNVCNNLTYFELIYGNHYITHQLSFYITSILESKYF